MTGEETTAVDELMAESSTAPDNTDPFSPENIGVVHFITQARIYDTLVAILTELNPEQAKRLLEVHQNGALFGPMPVFTGTFISDEINAEQDTTGSD